MGRKFTTEDFIKKARTVHGNKYDYSLSAYVTNSVPVKIICPKHGVFEQSPKVHYTGAGCTECLKESYFNAFIEKAKVVHGDKYDYSKVVYESGRKPVMIICPEHGEFQQSLENHIAGHGCPMCVGNKKSDADDFIEKARAVHGDKYDYSKVNYVNNKTKVMIICPEHGEFEQTPSHHLDGDGCPQCAVIERADFLREHASEINEKRKYTMLERYNVSNPMYNIEFKNKSYVTNLERYGVMTPFESKEIRKKSRQTMHDNGSFGTSKSEEQLYDLLCDKFGVNDIIRQYCSDVYPFACDFYIQSRNLYIELNAYYMHGRCWFNVADESHMNKIDEWQSFIFDGESSQYQSAIDIWTSRDVMKRDTARFHKLNYVVFWDNYLSDAKLWFAMDCPDGSDWEREYSWLPDRKLSRLELSDYIGSSRDLNKIVKHFQYDAFYKRELLLWNNNMLYQNKCLIQAFLYANRAEYLGKLPSELTDAEILRGMTISGILRGYTVFDAKLMCDVLQTYDIKSIYDPCAGWGERMLASVQNNVAYVGVDINEHLAEGYTNMIDYYDLCNQKFVCADAAKYVPNFDYDAVITCPPYGSIEKYTDKGAENLSDYEFYEWWNCVVDNATKSKPKYFCFQINTKYRNKMADIVCNHGYVLHDELFFKSNKSSHFTRKSSGVNLKKSRESMLVLKYDM